MPLVVAFRLLTILPVRGWRDATSREYGAAVRWYPAVGYVLGGVIALLDLVARRVSLPPGVTAWLLIAVLAVLTGFLHLDGVIDTWDAAFAHRSPAERLVIARDPRAGAFGVVGIVVLLGLKAALLTSPLGGQRTIVLWCVPALARAVMTAVVAEQWHCSPYDDLAVPRVMSTAQHVSGQKLGHCWLQPSTHSAPHSIPHERESVARLVPACSCDDK